VNPWSSFSTTNAVIPRERVPGATVANTVHRSSTGPFPMYFFVPFTT
jgi:hypothetical protein